VVGIEIVLSVSLYLALREKSRPTLSILAVLVLGCGLASQPACGHLETGEDATDSGFLVRETAEGIEVRDDGRLVLFYQRAPNVLDKEHSRNNYIHPLMSLDGDVLTEDLPEDHPHHRGIFWAWHQLWAGEERVGDSWILEDFVADVQQAETHIEDKEVRIDLDVRWRSQRFRGGDAFVEEQTAITIHSVVHSARVIDFEIALRALAPGVRIGGSEDAKGYGGFTTRLRMPDGLIFTGAGGTITPQELQVEAGSWVDLSASYGPDRDLSGIAILTHPSNPGAPPPWLLRQKGSMQNPVFPGRETTELSADRPLVLRYRLVVHRGRLEPAEIQGWQAAYDLL
jgi:hypothetical protein